MIFSLAFSACLMLAVANHHASAAMLGEVQSWKQDGKAVTFVCGKSLVRLEFWADDVVRVTLLSGGKSNPGSKHDVLLGANTHDEFLSNVAWRSVMCCMASSRGRGRYSMTKPTA